ncbi:GNAT family N-acetyltransferase [Segetibacter sp. 3557_3]|uniref:GNAT family N-acetyltransferase n=1 Tax=Segetibacter sp. 3557_3 TaxID=2547429 RepID=UPI001058D65F|nr:GNAT family N-acetyltransferase [Segetibacter sp. 3557_3]TDH26175.1 GNAT family N-acetyltransferase [Segetibacter sp. 3557_3]
MKEAEFSYACFDRLENKVLYAILRLRSEVFVVEQNCVFLDIDDKDQQSHHLTGWVNEKLAAYARIVPAGVAYDYNSIGRVVTSPSFRGTGLGRELLEKSIQYCYALHGVSPIKIGGQLYLQQFYESFGFKQTSEVYLEDGIAHIEMMLYP